MIWSLISSAVILSQSEGLHKIALGIVKYAYDRSSQLFSFGLRSVVVDPSDMATLFKPGVLKLLVLIIIIIITEICIAPFPEVNQIKGALQKIEKQFTHTAR